MRVLCLGNALLADDGFGLVVAARLRDLGLDLEICESSASGFDLLDAVLGTRSLTIVDTVQGRNAAPGTISSFREQDVQTVPGGSPHYVGLFEALRLGRALGLDVPDDVTVLAVDAADCQTVGGSMHPAVQAAVDEVITIILSGTTVVRASARAWQRRGGGSEA